MNMCSLRTFRLRAAALMLAMPLPMLGAASAQQVEVQEQGDRAAVLATAPMPAGCVAAAAGSDAAARPTYDVLKEITGLAKAERLDDAACVIARHLRELPSSRFYPLHHTLHAAIEAIEQGGAVKRAEEMQLRFVAAVREQGTEGVLLRELERHADLLTKTGNHVGAEAVLAELIATEAFASGSISRSDIYRLRARNSLAAGDHAAMRQWFEQALKELEPYPTLRPPFEKEYAEALASIGDVARADARFEAALAPGEFDHPTRPEGHHRQIMAERAVVMKRLGRAVEAEFYALPVKIVDQYEQRRWDEAIRLADRMVKLAPQVPGDPNALLMALEFRAAARNAARGNARPDYSPPRQLLLCGRWNPPEVRSTAASGLPMIVSTSAVPAKESFSFLYHPIRVGDPDGALIRAQERYISYAEGCERPQGTITVLEGARRLLDEQDYAVADYWELLIALGNAHARAGDFEAADRAYVAVADRLAEGEYLGDGLAGPGGTIQKIFDFYVDFGRYDRAELHVTRMLAAQTKRYGSDAVNLVRRGVLLELYLLQGRSKEAMALIDRKPRPPLPEGAQQDARAEIEAIQKWLLEEANVARLLVLRGDHEEAVAVLEPARDYGLQYLKALKDQGGNVFVFDVWRTFSAVHGPLADAYAGAGRLDDALKSYQAGAEGRLAEVENRMWEEEIRLFLVDAGRYARAGVAAGSTEEPKKYLKRARDLVANVPNPGDEAETAIWSASVALGIVDSTERGTALADGQKLFERLEQQWEVGSRSALDTEWQKRQLRSAGRLYANHASLLWTVSGNGSEAPRRDQAFRSVQRAVLDTADLSIANAAARALLERSNPEMVPVVEQRDALVRRYLAATSGQIADAAASAEQLDRLAKQLSELDARIRREAPDYFELIRSEPLSPAEAAALMAPDEAAVLIVPGEFGTQIMAVTREGVTWRSSALKQAEVADMVRRLLWFAGGGVQASEAEAQQWAREVEGGRNGFDRDTAFKLYGELIAPVRALLEGKKQVFIAGAGALSSLPFSMLVSAAPAGADNDPAALRSTRWFGDDIAIVQLSSLQALALLKKQSEQRQGSGESGFVGFGNPALDGAPVRRGDRNAADLPIGADLALPQNGEPAGRIANAEMLRALSQLPGTAEELQAMSGLFPGGNTRLFTGAEATETAVRRADLSKAGVITFATHGLTPHDSVRRGGRTITAGQIFGLAEPGLVLTPPRAASAADDGYLAASEIALLRLNADWVILSACNSAAGDGSRGAPGLSGMARAFFYAGARNLLATHWPVRDDVAARLTVRTMEIKRDTPALTRAQALAEAMKEIRREAKFDGVATNGFDGTWAHPNAWAPFTLIGSGR